MAWLPWLGKDQIGLESHVLENIPDTLEVLELFFGFLCQEDLTRWTGFSESPDATGALLSPALRTNANVEHLVGQTVDWPGATG